jgi:hypothetical protein
MSTNPPGPITPAGQIPNPNPSPTQITEALLFAQQLADHEIQSIERIHRRTLLSFGYVGIFVAAAIGVFGYIGYSNLRDASIASASAQMQKEVTKQVQEKLTEENINQIVRNQVRDLSATTLTAEIHKELNSPPLSTSILESADVEAQSQIKKQFSPRHFSPAQSKIFIAQLADMKDLPGCEVSVSPALFNVEATNYASEIKESLSHTKVVSIELINFDQPPVDGVGIYYDKQKSETCARHLQDALQTAGVSAKLVPGTPNLLGIANGNNPNSVVGPLEIFVGTKPME